MAEFMSPAKRNPDKKKKASGSSSPRRNVDISLESDSGEAPFLKPKGRNTNKPVRHREGENEDASDAFSADDNDNDDIEELEDEILQFDIGLSKLTLSQYKKKAEVIISQFFVHGDFEELTRDIIEINCPEYSYELVKRLVSMSLDKSDRERELVSQFISSPYAHPDPLSSNMIGKGFERLFEIMDEVERDVPAVREMLSKYLARAVLDESLPPSYLNDPVIMNLGKSNHAFSRRN
jgi:programmed cell death protein 4